MMFFGRQSSLIIGCLLTVLIHRFSLHADALRLTKKEQKEIIKRHLEIREQVGQEAAYMNMDITWSDAYANAANYHASACKALRMGPMNSMVGENHYVTTGTKISMKKVVDRWFGEGQNYDYRANECEEGKECFRYKQIVAEQLNTMGCGYNKCKELGSQKKAWYLICLYYPSVMSNQRPYEEMESEDLEEDEEEEEGGSDEDEGDDDDDVDGVGDNKDEGVGIKEVRRDNDGVNAVRINPVRSDNVGSEAVKTTQDGSSGEDDDEEDSDDDDGVSKK